VMVASLAVAALTSDRWPGLPPRPATRVFAIPTANGARALPIPTGGVLLGMIVAIAAGVAFGLAVMERLVPAIAWLSIGAFVAIALRRPSGWLERLRLRPYVARSIVLAMVGGVIVLSVVASTTSRTRRSSVHGCGNETRPPGCRSRSRTCRSGSGAPNPPRGCPG
jgi:hypothetical protein